MEISNLHTPINSLWYKKEATKDNWQLLNFYLMEY